MRFLAPITANVILVMSALGFGSLLWRLPPANFSKLDRISLTLLGGLGIQGTLLFCLGQVQFTRISILFTLILGVVLLADRSFRINQRIRAATRNFSAPLVPATIISAIVLLTAVSGLALPIGDTNNDAIAYHYLGPKVWLNELAIRPVADEMQTSFPVIVETQYAALMALGGQRAPQLFAVISVISILLMTASLALRFGIRSAGVWWAVALVVTMPAVHEGIHGGFIDALFAAFILASARIAFDAERPSHFVLLGIFCGICMGTKYTGIIAWALLVACVFAFMPWTPRKDFIKGLTYLGLASLVALVFACPIYLRNFLFLGSPIYPPPPILYKLFQTKYLTQEAVLGFHKYILRRGAGMGRGLSAYFTLPFNLTYHTANFHGAGGIGIAPLALAPVGLISCLNQRFARGIALFAFLSTTAWFLTEQESRFLISIYAISGIFAAIGWEYISHVQSRFVRLLAASVVAASILYGLVMIIPERTSDLHAALSSSFEIRLMNKEIPQLAAFEFLNADRNVRKVLILNPDLPTYYLDKPYLKPFGRWGEQTLPHVGSALEAIAKIQELHVTHIWDVKSNSGAFEIPENTPNLAVVFESDCGRIYRLVN